MKCPYDDSRQILMHLKNAWPDEEQNTMNPNCLVFKGTHTTVCPLSVEQSFKQTILRQLTILNDGVLKLVVCNSLSRLYYTLRKRENKKSLSF